MSEHLSERLADDHQRRMMSHAEWHRSELTSRIPRPKSSRPSLSDQVAEDDSGNDGSFGGVQHTSAIEDDRIVANAHLESPSKLHSQVQLPMDEHNKFTIVMFGALVVLVILLLLRHPNICFPMNTKFRGFYDKHVGSNYQKHEARDELHASSTHSKRPSMEPAGSTIDRMLRFA